MANHQPIGRNADLQRVTGRPPPSYSDFKKLKKLQHEILSSQSIIGEGLTAINSAVQRTLAEIILTGNTLQQVREIVGPEAFKPWCGTHLMRMKSSTVNVYLQAAQNVTDGSHHTKGILAALGVEICRRTPFTREH